MLDWIGASLIIVSIYLIGKQKPIGWIINTLGCIMYIIVGYKNHLYGWILMEFVLICLNIYNYINWKKL